MGKVFVVGIGPGNFENMTIRADRVLAACDAIVGYPVYVDLVKDRYPGKALFETPMTQEAKRCQLALDLAREGRQVCIVCSGDSGIYGMAALVYELRGECAQPEIEVVPGLTAACSGGAGLGAPLAHDFCVLSLSDRLTPWEVIEKRLAAAAMGDFCMAVYNPSSKGRPDYLGPGRAHPAAKRQGPGHRLWTGAQHRPGGPERSGADAGPAGANARGYVYHRVHRQPQHPGAAGPHGHAAGVPRMRAVVFSGTTEGRIFSRQLAQLGADVLVSVATPLGSEEQGSFAGITVHCGRLTPDEMAALVQGADLCVDATHPYAVDATRNIRTACRTAGVEYHRLLRAQSPLPAGSMVFQSAAHVADFLVQTQGNVLLATGAKELPAFAQLAPERLYPRVLPTLDGIAACEAAHIPHKNILALQGPFSYALNRALLEQFSIRFLVTKDGGAAGGFAEKAQAAADTGVQLIVIRRPAETGETADQILTRCREVLKG